MELQGRRSLAYWRYMRACLRAHSVNLEALDERAARDAFWVLEKLGKVPSFAAFYKARMKGG